jgi:hypothetical protein
LAAGFGQNAGLIVTAARPPPIAHSRPISANLSGNPLAPDDDDVVIDLQSAFTIVYDEAGYDYSLNYRAPVVPRPTADEERWMADCLQAAGAE